MAESIYNTSSVAPLQQIQLFLFLSRSRDRKQQLLSGHVFCVGVTRTLLKNLRGMALNLKSQPSPHPPTPRLQQDPCPGCQPPTTTPPSGRTYPHTQPPAHHHPATASFGLRKLPPRCPVVMGFGSRIHQAPPGGRMPGAYGHRPNSTLPLMAASTRVCSQRPTTTRQLLATADTAPNTTGNRVPRHIRTPKHHHPVTDAPGLVTTKPHGRRLRHV